MADDRPDQRVPDSSDRTKTDRPGSRTAEPSSDPAPPDTGHPSQIGPYRILRKIGEGGMGIVYEAEQQEPRRKVALKVIRGGTFVDDAALRMFQREANTLARLDHPNIGAIYESGRTEDGQHFFAMELVRGRTLNAYLAARPKVLTKEELRHRLALFREIADAVHYAHQRGVIHRDLKPSNLIVIEKERGGDGSGSGARLPQVKVLDFGLARITDADVSATRTTEVGAIKGTLPYMSPEQARGNPEDIDLRADVYALGVILYEMLAGARPYPLEHVPLVEAVRVICDQSPRPLGESWSGTHKLDVDIETIVGRALEKEADRRYASAAALADDVGRYLTSQPILARPPSTFYHLRKFAGRNRALVGGVTATFVVLVAGAVASTVLGLKEATQRRAAERANDGLETVVEFQSDMLARVDPEEAGRLLFAEWREKVVEEQRRRGAGDQDLATALASFSDLFGNVNATTVARSVLDENVLKPAERTIDAEFGDRPLIEARLRNTVGEVYSTLGLYESAEPLLTESLALRREMLGDDHPDTLQSTNNLASLYKSQGRYDEAEPLYLETLERCRRVLGDDHQHTLQSMNSLASLYKSQGRYDEAEALYLQGLEKCRRVLGDDHPDTLNSMNNLAGLYDSQGEYDEAEPLYLETLGSCRRVLGDDHRDTLTTMNNLALLYHNQGRYDEAEPLYLETLETRKRVLGDDHPHTLISMNNLALMYYNQGRYDEAEPLYLETLETRKRVLIDDHPDTFTSMNNLAVLYYNQGRYDETEPLYLEILATRRRVLGDDHPNTLISMNNLALLYRSQGRYDDAEPLYLEALEHCRHKLGNDHPNTLITMINLADLYLQSGRPVEAEPLLTEAVAAVGSGLPREHPASGVAMLRYGACLSELRRYDEAEAQLLEAYETLVAVLGSDHAQTRKVITNLVKLYEVLGKADEADEWGARLPTEEKATG